MILVLKYGLKLILFSILVNFSFSQKSYEKIASNFIEESFNYFTLIISKDSVDIPFSESTIELYTEDVNDGVYDSIAVKDQVYLNYFLFCFLKNIDHPEAVSVGLNAYRLSQSIEERSSDLRYIEGSYQLYISEQSSWNKFKYMFTNLYDSKEEAITKILSPVETFRPLYTINMYTQANIYLTEKFNYDKAKSLFERLLNKYPNSEKILSEYMNVVYQAGYFEDAILVLHPLLNATDDKNERVLLLSYLAKCYYFLGDFDICTQYFYQIAKIDSGEKQHEAILHIAKSSILTNHMDSLVLDSLWNWFDEFGQKDEAQNLSEFSLKYDSSDLRILQEVEYLLNRSDIHLAKQKLIEIDRFKSHSDEFQANYMLLFGKILWLEKDYFNAKRYLHNLNNQYEAILDSYMKCSMNLILSDISYKASDYEQSFVYLNEINEDALPFYQKHKFYFLKNELKEF